jgi:AcrR family transcriptional regulator
VTDSSSSTRGRPVNEAARADRTAQILAGARRCFIEHGFHASAVTKISETAGVSVANIYQYFPNKDALIEALIQEDIERELEFIRLIEMSGLSTDAMRPILAPYFETGIGREVAILASEMVSEASRNPKIAMMQAVALDQAKAAIARAVEREQRAGRINCAVSPDCAASMICLIFDSMTRRLIYTPTPGHELLDELLKHFDFILNAR